MIEMIMMLIEKTLKDKTGPDAQNIFSKVMAVTCSQNSYNSTTTAIT